MGATTYRLMSDLASADEAGTEVLAGRPKVIFSTTLTEPLAWPNTELVSRDPVAVVREMKAAGNRPLTTLGSLTLCRALLKAGLVDRFRVSIFPRYHWQYRDGQDLRRQPRRGPQPGRASHLRWSHPAPRVRPEGAVRTARDLQVECHR